MWGAKLGYHVLKSGFVVSGGIVEGFFRCGEELEDLRM